jgi:hypothetical protein
LVHRLVELRACEKTLQVIGIELARRSRSYYPAIA